jgi:hypothetical protein
MPEVAIMRLAISFCLSIALQLLWHGLPTVPLTLANDKQPPVVTSDSPAKKEASASELDALIRQLGSPDFRERETAERKLEAIGKPALNALRKAAKEQTDPEVHARIERLIDRFGSDRHKFAKRLSTIKEGMKKAEVLRILGKPDDHGGPDDFIGAVPMGCTEIWAFGTNGHGTFPMLGAIYFNKANEVIGTRGGHGTPPPTSMFTEVELRKLLTLIVGPRRWDPAWAIKVVNTLQPLGKRKALAAIEEFARVSDYLDDLEMMLMLQVLFEVPKDPGYMAETPYPVTPPNPKDRRVPRYPILILGDVPLLIASGLPFSSGPGPDVGKQIAFFRDHAKIRAQPLQPTDKPLRLYSEWKTYDWLYRDSKYLEYITPGAIPMGVERQLGELVKTVYRGDIKHGTLARPIRWDIKRNMYTFLDGTTLPDDSDKDEKKTR